MHAKIGKFFAASRPGHASEPLDFLLRDSLSAAFLQPFLGPVAIWKSKASQQGFASLTQAVSDLVTLREVTHRHLDANVFFCFIKFYG